VAQTGCEPGILVLELLFSVESDFGKLMNAEQFSKKESLAYL
jgi:hypothetical protein